MRMSLPFLYFRCRRVKQPRTAFYKGTGKVPEVRPPPGDKSGSQITLKNFKIPIDRSEKK